MPERDSEHFHVPSDSDDRLGASINQMGRIGANLDRIVAWMEPRRDILTDELMSFLNRAAQESGEAPEDVLWKGLTLFLMASEAERAGRKLAILDDRDVIVEEIRGIGSPLIRSARPMVGSGETVS